MRLADFEEILKILQSLHLSLKDELGVRNKSKKWAIWLLLGAHLGLAVRSIRLAKERDGVSVQILSRLVTEYEKQIEYFVLHASVDDMKKWWRTFDKKKSGTKPEEVSSYLANIRYTNYKKSAIWKDGFSRNVNDLLSLSSHPSYDLTARLFISDKNDGKGTAYNFMFTDYDDDYIVHLLTLNFMPVINAFYRGVNYFKSVTGARYLTYIASQYDLLKR